VNAGVIRRPRVNRRLALDGERVAREVIGALDPGVAMTGLTMGQFSLLDLIRACLDSTGPAHCIVSTWTTGIRDAEQAAWLLSEGRLLSFGLLTDVSFPARQPEYCAFLTRRFGPDCVRSTRTHAKFALIWNEAWSLVVRSSMNLNVNPRFEQFDIDDSSELLAFFRSHVDTMPVGFDAAQVEMSFAAFRSQAPTVAEREKGRIARSREKMHARRTLDGGKAAP
jgi:hypothetical protein